MLPEYSDRYLGVSDTRHFAEALPAAVRHREQLVVELANYLHGLSETPRVFGYAGMVAKPAPRYHHDQKQLKQLLTEISEAQHTINLVTWVPAGRDLPENTQCLLFNSRGELIYFGAALFMPEWVAGAKLRTEPLKQTDEYHCYLLSSGLFTAK